MAFDDGSYKSWIAPDGQSKKKVATRMPIRVIEYIVEENGTELETTAYRLYTRFLLGVNLSPRQHKSAI